MLREDLKKELDKLNDEQLKKIADFIADLEFQARQVVPSVPFWQRATPSDRAREFREWVLQLPKGSPSLRDEAFSRDSIYE
jgi:MoaA/NifB/PqqE/SkfB family radical SAM enzyme